MKISIIGTGRMGTAFAVTLLKASRQITVWDKHIEATKVAVENGAVLAHSFEEALENADVVLSLVSSASIGFELFKNVDKKYLSNKFVINYSTALPEDGEKFNNLISENNGYYLSAAITSYPDLIGTDYTVIQYSGENSYFEKVGDLLQPLSPDATLYVGVDLQKPAVVDAAMTGSFYAVALAGFIECAAYLNSKGYNPMDSEEFAYKAIDLLKYKVKKTLQEIEKNDFSTIQVGVSVYLDAVIQWRDAVQDSGLKGTLIAALADDLGDALERGNGHLAFSSQYLSAAKI